MRISALLRADFATDVKQINRDEELRWTQDQATVQEWSARALKAFRDLVPLAQALGEGKADKKSLKAWSPLVQWTQAYAGEKGLTKAVNLLLAALEDFKPAVENKVKLLAENNWKASELAKSRKPLEAFPKEILKYLPPSLVVDLDTDGTVKTLTTRFDNMRETLAAKIATQHEILEKYNDIVEKVKRDLKSPDEKTKLCALVTSIIMETGIRPGREGTQTIVIENGEKVPVETFGATTLGAHHIKFVKDNFAELEFVGKASTVNMTKISDGGIVKLLQQYADQAKTKQFKYIFVTKDGERVTDSTLKRYFDKQFKGLSPTDFRKLRGTQAVLDSLYEQQVDLYKEIKNAIADATIDATQAVADAIAKVLEKATKDAQKTLNHEDVETTINKYINPEVILSFLTQGQVPRDLKQAILTNKLKLDFDPQAFVSRAVGIQAAAGRSLADVLTALEEEIGGGTPIGTLTKMARALRCAGKVVWIPENGEASLTRWDLTGRKQDRYKRVDFPWVKKLIEKWTSSNRPELWIQVYAWGPNGKAAHDLMGKEFKYTDLKAAQTYAKELVASGKASMTLVEARVRVYSKEHVVKTFGRYEIQED